MPRDEPWHQCNYPGDDYGCENIPDSVKPKKVDRGDNRCGRCDFDGYSSSFCYVDPVGNILATVVVEYKNQGCQKGAVEKRDGVHQPPRYHNFSTEAAPACYSTSQYGKPCVPGRTSGIPFDCKGGKCEDGQCCSPTEPQKTCVALGNGMCPDAGSHTQCEDPAEPGPWSCSWVQDELVNPVEKYWKLEAYDTDDDFAAAAPAHDAESCYPKWHDCSYDDDCCDDNTCQPIKGTTVCFNGRRDDDWPLGAAELNESDDDHAHDDDDADAAPLPCHRGAPLTPFRSPPPGLAL